MFEVLLNGQKEILAESISLTELLGRFSLPTEATAIAVNDEVIPRSLWNEVQIRENDSVEIIRAVGGG
ncbi:MAG: sulfur carrier protein ThiS [Deltaproteobacteria bacterium]|nr:sulfur carrier protein ThiS [Deltaproteobacteria bacterium]